MNENLNLTKILILIIYKSGLEVMSLSYIDINNVKPVKKCDVLVAGGGFAGISAALSAARNGSKVILVENSYVLGGLATSGLITIILPICDGEGRQVCFGIVEELLRLSVKYAVEEDAPEWLLGGTLEERKKHRFKVRFNASFFVLMVEKLLLSEGVEIVYGTRVCDVLKENDRIKYCIVDNKSGFNAIEVSKSVVDATGDSDICCFAGEDTALYEDKNTLASWYYYADRDGLNVRTLGYVETFESGTEIEKLASGGVKRLFSGIDGFENSEMVQLSHKQMLIDMIKHYENDKRCVPTSVPSIPQLRMTRRICGVSTFDVDSNHKYCENSVGIITNWWACGQIYEVPFDVLYGRKVKNLICAGRNISATDEMWKISRVIPYCAVTGQAAGTAASMCSDFSSLDVSALQEKLKNDGVVLHERDL